MVGRLKKVIFALVLVLVIVESGSTQTLVEKQLQYLTNPKGWVVHSVVSVSFREPVKEELGDWSPCVKSGVWIFKKDGTFTETFPIKNCPDQHVEDVNGSWYHKANPEIRDGIISISAQNSAIQHDWRHFDVISLTETVMIAVNNASFGNFWEKVWILKIRGTELPENHLANNPYQSMEPKQSDFDLTRYFSGDEIKAANTAAASNFLTKDEKLIYLHSNLARMYPAKYKVLIEGYVSMLPDYIRPGVLNDKIYYGSLMKDLVQRKPAAALMPDKPLYNFALCWAQESGNLGVTGHDRVTCKDFGYGGENCSYGSYTPHEIVISLLIDYNVDGFGHRENLLNPGYSKMGAAIHPHKSTYGICAVQDFQ